MSALRAGRRIVAGLAMLCAVACGKQKSPAPFVSGGNADRGKVAIARYGCGSCHEIAGVTGAHGLVGPPLTEVAQRVYIAGVLVNEPDNIVRWIMNPPAVDAKTAMPNLGVTERDARDIAEYLYRSKGG
ncbi:MAG: c-type cytochrome [Gemmatimonadaceae bacterium]